MSRRRQRLPALAPVAPDPGKDLFAYLFLLMVVFVFVLLLTLHQVQNPTALRQAPRPEAPRADSTLKTLSSQQFGRLGKENQQLVLRFGPDLFDPQRDVAALLASPYLVREQGAGGTMQATLYLSAESAQQVLLNEYLRAFSALSQAGISVAFAETAEEP